ncbi:hypothetical protein CYMTET_12652 [Cymbomonas tetramitiformis]|uniref:Uncharacterized protein n=1 Tax=Cymbomonas tetramitiformis TaxID=36881 RepID=A0AAE0LBV0_9CHLO|nr:hypothetical protein CYMTET_12652 [Cymbomonas tetramitiformis]
MTGRDFHNRKIASYGVHFGHCAFPHVVEDGGSAELAGTVTASDAASGGASVGGAAVHSAMPKGSVSHATLSAGGAGIAPDTPAVQWVITVFTVPTKESAGYVRVETSADEFPGGVTALGAHSCAVGNDSDYDTGD